MSCYALPGSPETAWREKKGLVCQNGDTRRRKASMFSL